MAQHDSPTTDADTICLTCGRQLLDRDHAHWCDHRVRRRSGVRLVRAGEIEPENVDYLDERLIPLKVVTLVTGIDGVGKSTLLYSKGALGTRGRLPGKFYGTPIDIVIASSEDHPGSVIVPRLVAAGADLWRVHIVKVHRDGLDGDISLPGDLDAVAEEVQQVGARFLIVDPLVAHMPLNIDSHKAQHVRSVLAPLARLAEESQLAVAAVVHFNGAPSTDVRTRISGSKALRDAARSVLVCGTDPADESRFVMVQDKHSFGPKSTIGHAYRIEGIEIEHKAISCQTSRIVWCGEVEIDSRSMLAGPGDPEERTERDEAATWLVQLLTEEDGRMLARDVKAAARDAGIAERTLHRARRGAGIVIERDENTRGRPSTWRLPDYVPPPDGTKPPGTKPEPHGLNGSGPSEGVSCQPPDAGTKPKSEPMAYDEARALTDKIKLGLKLRAGQQLGVDELALARELYPDDEAVR